MHKFNDYTDTGHYETTKHSPKRIGYNNHDYTSQKHVQRQTTHTIPYTNTPLCVLPIIDSVVFKSEKGINVWNYKNNQSNEIEFSSEVTHFVVFTPKKGVLKVETCVLIATVDELILYGIVDYRFVNTGLVTSLPDRIVRIVAKEGVVYLATENDVYEVVYTSSFFRRFYLSRLRSFLSLRKSKFVIDISISGPYLIVLHPKNIAVYRNKIELYNVISNPGVVNNASNLGPMFNSAYNQSDLAKAYPVGVEIVEYDLSEVFYFIILSDGTRDLYYNNNFISNRSSPLSGILSNYAYNGNDLILLKNNMVSVIHYNFEQKVNSRNNRPCENHEYLSAENVKHIFLENNLHVFTSDSMHIFEISDYFPIVRAEDAFYLYGILGPREYFYHKYDLMSKGENTTVFDVKTCSALEKKQAVYSFIYRLFKDDFNAPINKVLLSCDSRVSHLLRLNKSLEDPLISHVVHTLAFLKVYINYHTISHPLYSLLFNSTIIKQLLADLVDSTRFDSLFSTLLQRCPSFFDSDDFISFRGRSYLYKGDIKNSMEFYKKLKRGNSIIDELISLRYFDSAVVLIRRYELTIPEIYDYLKRCLCTELAISIAIADHREWFIFICVDILCASNNAQLKVLGVKTVPIVNNKLEIMCGNGVESGLEIKSSMFKLNSPFVEQCLIDRCRASYREEDYNLIWKYYVYTNNSEKLVDILIEIATQKPLKLAKRIELFCIANSIKLVGDVLRVAKIQSDCLGRQFDVKLEYDLIESTELLHEYLIPLNHFDLALKLVDGYEYVEDSILNKIWSGAFMTMNLKDLGNMNLCNALRLEIVGPLLMNSNRLFECLMELNTSNSDIVKYFEFLIKAENKPNKKKRIVEMMEQCNLEDANLKRILSGVKTRYGV